MDGLHFAAGGMAITLMLVGLMLILGWDRIRRRVITLVLGAMVALYVVGAAIVVTLGVRLE